MVLLAALLSALSLTAPPARATVERTLALPAGPAGASFAFTVNAVYADRVDLVVPHGAAVSVVARSLDGKMGLGASTRPWQTSCRRRGAIDVCSQPMEACPLSDDSWRATVRKTSAAPAVVRVRLVFVTSGA